MGFRIMGHVVDPSLTLLNSNASPFGFRHQMRFWNHFGQVFRQHHMAIFKFFVRIFVGIINVFAWHSVIQARIWSFRLIYVKKCIKTYFFVEFRRNFKKILVKTSLLRACTATATCYAWRLAPKFVVFSNFSDDLK